MGGNSDTVVPTEKAIVTYITTTLAGGSGTAFKLKDAQDDTGINVDTVGNGSADTIVMTTAGSTRLTIGNTGQITTASSYTPSASYDLTTKTYVDALISALNTTAISQLNSNVTVSDSGTGSISITADGTVMLTVQADRIRANSSYTPSNSYDLTTKTYVDTAATSAASAAVGASWTSVSSSQSITSGNRYWVDTTSNTITLTLPGSPTAGDFVQIIDIASNAATRNITVARNGNKIMNTSENLVMNINGSAVRLVYTGASFGWVLETL
jgi:hypothetical protein